LPFRWRGVFLGVGGDGDDGEGGDGVDDLREEFVAAGPSSEWGPGAVDGGVFGEVDGEGDEPADAGDAGVAGAVERDGEVDVVVVEEVGLERVEAFV